MPATSEIPASVWRNLAAPDWQVRKQAIQELSSWAPFETIQDAVLDRLLQTEDPVLRNALIEVLTTVGVTVVPAVVDALDHAVNGPRKFLIDVLAAIGSPLAAPRLIRLLDEPDVNVRHAAIEALGQIAVPMAGEALLQHVQRTGDPSEQFVTLQALTELLRRGVPISIDLSTLTPLRDQTLLTRALFDLLGELPAREALPFVFAWLPELDVLRLQDAAAYLSALPPDEIRHYCQLAGFPELQITRDDALSLLRGQQDHIRTGAVWIALFAGHTAEVTALACREPFLATQPHIIAALASLPDADFANVVNQLVPLPEQRRLLLDIIASRRDPAYWQVISQIPAEEQGDDLRLFRAGCLVGAQEQVARLPSLLDRYGADEQLIEALQAILPEQREIVMQALLPWATEAVGNGNWEALLTLVERLNLAGLGLHVERVWKRAEPHLRARALSILARYRLDFARQYLALGLADRNPEVRLAAAEILHEIADEKLEREARTLLLDREPWLRAVGLSTLARILGPDVIQTAAEFLSDSGDAVRLEAVRLLRTMRAREYTGRVRAMLPRETSGDIRAELIRYLQVNAVEPRDEDVDLLRDQFWRARYEACRWFSGYERFREQLAAVLQVESDTDLRVLLGSSGTLRSHSENRMWFRAISEHVYAASGIQLHLENRAIYERKVQQLAQAAGCPHLGDYYQRLRYHLDAEAITQHLIESITTGETYFFRELSQLEYFLDDLLPGLPDYASGGQATIWSAGCSTGEEAYTLSILLDRAGIGRNRATIIAGDISAPSLEQARTGIYRENAFRTLSPDIRAQYFDQIAPGRWQIHQEQMDRVEFVTLNLVNSDSLALLPPADAIFCRNVLIYFDRAAKERAVRNMWHALKPGGVLLLGHAESLLNLEHPFQAEQRGGHVCYRKPR
ncbi:MAG: hypothetical protein D6761_01610 [Candidatus Dadabacteria bacterium]|nr:MAG: hypothetical protein D6761_01610 [Candidatus Dadabacteria bacterium]